MRQLPVLHVVPSDNEDGEQNPNMQSERCVEKLDDEEVRHLVTVKVDVL